MIQRLLAIWSLVLLPFLNPAYTSGRSWFTDCQSLAWRILSITLLECEMSPSMWQFEHSLALEWKLTFSSPMATAEFFKFAGMLSAASSFTASSFRIWNSSTGIPSPPLALLVVMLPEAHLTSHSRMSGSRSVIPPWWFSGLWRSFLYSSCVFLLPLLLPLLGPYHFSLLLCPSLHEMFPWYLKFFLKILFSSISLHWSLRNAYLLSLLGILWNSAFKCVYLSFSPLLLKEMGIPDHLYL